MQASQKSPMNKNYNIQRIKNYKSFSEKMERNTKKNSHILVNFH